MDELIEIMRERYGVTWFQVNRMHSAELNLRGFKMPGEPAQEESISGKFVRNTREREKIGHNVKKVVDDDRRDRGGVPSTW
jgi:bacillopeptidase F (M6 metalloprotease family)